MSHLTFPTIHRSRGRSLTDEISPHFPYDMMTMLLILTQIQKKLRSRLAMQ